MDSPSPRQQRATASKNEAESTLQEIADTAWRHFNEPGAEIIYGICRDRLGVCAGRNGEMRPIVGREFS